MKKENATEYMTKALSICCTTNLTPSSDNYYYSDEDGDCLHWGQAWPTIGWGPEDPGEIIEIFVAPTLKTSEIIRVLNKIISLLESHDIMNEFLKDLRRG